MGASRQWSWGEGLEEEWLRLDTWVDISVAIDIEVCASVLIARLGTTGNDKSRDHHECHRRSQIL